MKNLKAIHPISYYKDKEAWMDAVYRNNKEAIDKGLDGFGAKPKTVFKKIIKEHMEQGMTAFQATKTLARSTLLTPSMERLSTNVQQALKTSKVYKEFRDITRGEKGRFQKYDPSKMEYIGNNMYRYGNIIIDMGKYASEKHVTLKVT